MPDGIPVQRQRVVSELRACRVVVDDEYARAAAGGRIRANGSSMFLRHDQDEGINFTRRSITGMSSRLTARLETKARAPAFVAAERWLESSKPETMTTEVWGERSRTIRVPSTPSTPGSRKSMSTRSTFSDSTILSASPTLPASRNWNRANEVWMRSHSARLTAA